MTMSEIAIVAEKFLELHKAHPDYTVLSLTLGNERGKQYEKWNIYTAVLSHNTFDNPESIDSFITKILVGGDERYLKWKLETKRESLAYHMEQVKELQEEIAFLQEGKP
jgi:hypothetical protein